MYFQIGYFVLMIAYVYLCFDWVSSQHRAQRSRQSLRVEARTITLTLNLL